MAIEKVREYFSKFGMADRIRKFDVSSAELEAYSGYISWIDVCKNWQAI